MFDGCTVSFYHELYFIIIRGAMSLMYGALPVPISPEITKNKKNYWHFTSSKGSVCSNDRVCHIMSDLKAS